MLSTSPSRRVVSLSSTTAWRVQVLPDTHPYWIELLRRSGVPVGVLGAVPDGPPEAAILFLAGKECLRSHSVLEQVRRFRERGATAVADAHWAAALTGCGILDARATGITGGGPLFESCEEIRLPVDIPVAASADLGRVWPRGNPAALCITRPAPLVVLPLPEPEDLLRAHPRLVSFPAGDGREVSEIVSACDHGALRRLVCNALRLASFAIGQPFLRLGTAPRGYRGVLALRVDADGFDAIATRNTAEALRQSKMRATWFIDVERHLRGDMSRALRELRLGGNEVQSHFFHHYTYRSFRANFENLRRSIDRLRESGFEVNAAAAPFGSWNPGLARALATTAVAYSSEFACRHDDLPCASRGWSSTGFAQDPWQIPIHPVCPILLFDAGLDEHAIHEYFTLRLRERLDRGEPAVFYGHPIRDLERCPRLFLHLDAELRRSQEQGCGDVWRATLGELHSFYRARAQQGTEFRLGEGRVEGDLSGPAALWIEQAGMAPIPIEGPCTLPLLSSPHTLRSEEEPGMPECWRPRALRRLRWRERRIRFARWFREVRR